MKKQPSMKAQFALLAHIYKLEIIELCSMTGMWLIGAIEELAAMAWSIAVYNPWHHRHHHQRRHR